MSFKNPDRKYCQERFSKIKFMKHLIDKGQPIVVTAKDKLILEEYRRVLDGKDILPSSQRQRDILNEMPGELISKTPYEPHN
jgi:hypothetical protein